MHQSPASVAKQGQTAGLQGAEFKSRVRGTHDDGIVLPSTEREPVDILSAVYEEHVCRPLQAAASAGESLGGKLHAGLVVARSREQATWRETLEESFTTRLFKMAKH